MNNLKHKSATFVVYTPKFGGVHGNIDWDTVVRHKSVICLTKR